VRKSILLLFLLLISPLRADQYSFVGNLQSYQSDEHKLHLITDNTRIILTVLDDHIIRVQVGKGARPDSAQSYTVVLQPEPVDWGVNDLGDSLALETTAMRVNIRKSPLRLSFCDLEGRVLSRDDPAFGHGWDGKEVRAWKSLFPDERFYGLGEKTGNLNKRGNYYQMWNSDIPAYGNSTDPLYQSIPFFIGVRPRGAYGIFFDNTFRSGFNLGAGNDRVLEFGAWDGPMDYYFIAGPEISTVVKHYQRLTGFMPLPPRWALGYQQSRWSYYPESEVRDLAANFRTRNIPADVIYFDIHYMDAYKVFTWHPERFAQPKKMLSDLRAQGFKVITIIDPGIKVEQGYSVYDEGVSGRHFLTWPDGQFFSGQVWPGWCHFPDFSSTLSRQWWGRQFSGLLNDGIAGFWIDMNEPAVWGKEFPLLVQFNDEGRKSTIRKMHNLYGYQMAQATFDGLRTSRENQRPFIVTRAGYAGIQKYAAVWTGDNVASFDHLGLAVRMALGLSLSGVPFVGADVGGFVDSPSPELFARWIQVGTFTPFFRTHSHHDTRDQEPWSFGEQVENNVRDYISLRYRLMPYLYTAIQKAATTGTPVMRPVFYDFQSDEKTFYDSWQHQYFFGDDFLVAPVLKEGQEITRIYLPEGDWLDWWSGTVYRGPAEIKLDTPWWRLPLFVREGAIIPSRETTQYVDETPFTHLVLDIFPATGSKRELYLDDGRSYDFEHGKFRLVDMTCRRENDLTRISLKRGDGVFHDEIGNVTIRLHNSRDAAGISVNGRTIPLDGITRYDTGRRMLEIQAIPMADDLEIAVRHL
jgi:alpha-glucosidase